jgi:hypothetical protein
VVVRPTRAQIANATEHIEYTNELSQTECPITLEPFQEGEPVCRIIHCGHIFKNDGLTRWFQGNVRCPVCRFDIRDYTRQSIMDQEDDNNDGDDNENVDDEED